MKNKQTLYLDDLHIGMQFQSESYQISEQQIVDFAKEFDPQIFHLDATEAKNTFFRGLAASGWHTASITMRLLVQSFPIGCGIVGAGGEIKWLIPIRASDKLKVISTVLSVTPSKSKPDRGIVSLECKTVNQNDRICQHLVTQLVVFRKSDERRNY